MGTIDFKIDEFLTTCISFFPQESVYDYFTKVFLDERSRKTLGIMKRYDNPRILSKLINFFE